MHNKTHERKQWFWKPEACQLSWLNAKMANSFMLHANTNCLVPASWKAKHKRILKIRQVLPVRRLGRTTNILSGLGGNSAAVFIHTFHSWLSQRKWEKKMIVFPQSKTSTLWPTWHSQPSPLGDKVRKLIFSLSGRLLPVTKLRHVINLAPREEFPSLAHVGFRNS